MTRTYKILFLGLFLISGASGLIYEIVWSRLLALVFGGTTFAVTTVLACFMGGLALGSYAMGRWGENVRRPARLYGILELAIGGYCVFTPTMLDAAVPIYRFLVRQGGDSFVLLSAARAAISGLILLFPTMCMGATLPLLVKAFARREGRIGSGVALLYGFNTAGAFAGCAATGFFLIPAIGLSASLLCAAILNAIAGIGAIAFSYNNRLNQRHGESAAQTWAERADLWGGSDRRAPREIPQNAMTGRRRTLLILYGLSGFAAMALQVAWTRALILSLGSSTYAFSAIVACYILGLALGSLAISPWVDRLKNPLRGAGVLSAAIALSTLFVAPLFGEMPGLVRSIIEMPDLPFSRVLLLEILCVFLLLAIPTFCMGALMPLVCRAYDPQAHSAARSVGSVYASNTLGNILGVAATGFILIPAAVVGMQRAIIIASLLNGAIATAFILWSMPARRRIAIAAAACLWALWVAGATLSEPWSRSVMVSGPYLGRGTAEYELAMYIEDIDATVSVTTTPDGQHKSLKVNGKPDASTGYPDMVTQYLLSHVPLSLRPDSKEICVIGLGSGATAGAALAHPVESVDVAEISAGVVKAAEHFSEINNNALDDPRLTVHRADGRNFLLLNDRKYDIIVSEPSNPWIAGVTNLFTREFFELARSRLKPGGLHCQWIQAYNMHPDDFAAVLKTFSSRFDHVQLWESYFFDFLIIGSQKPIEFDLESMYFAWSQIDPPEMLDRIFIHDPMQLAAHYIGEGSELSEWFKDVPLVTDDRPFLEFSAPRYLVLRYNIFRSTHLYLYSLEQMPGVRGDPRRPINQRFLQWVDASRYAGLQRCQMHQARDNKSLDGYLEAAALLAEYARRDARMLMHLIEHIEQEMADAPEDVQQAMKNAVAEIEQDNPAFAGFLNQRNRNWDGVYWPFTRNIQPIPSPEVDSIIDEVDRLAADGQYAAAYNRTLDALELAPDNFVAVGLAGTMALNAGEPSHALPHLLKTRAMQPDSATANYHLARAYAALGNKNRALDLLEDAITFGFDDKQRLETSTAFQTLRHTPRFQQLTQSLQ